MGEHVGEAAAARPTTISARSVRSRSMSAAPVEVHFRDVSYRDLSLKRVVPEQLSPNYRMLRLTPFYYSFASGAADFDRDGNMDIVSGPFIFLGPDFTKVREFYMALSTNPVDELLVELARVRRRLHRRRLARRAARVDVGYAALRESERRAAALGFVSRASCRRRPTSRKCRR